MTATAEKLAPAPLRIDFGCGMNKRAGFVGVDKFAMPGVDHVFDIGAGNWPFADSSVEEAHASHFLEHLTNREGKWERVKFFNELYRVLIPGGKATLIFPHWASTRYYGDPTHCEPFSEFGFYYLSREWRLGNPEKGLGPNAPHDDISINPDGYSCDFEAVWGNGMHPALAVRNSDHQQFAMMWYKEAIQDLHATLTKR
jgi:SAM-dependent methyltransferase